MFIAAPAVTASRGDMTALEPGPWPGVFTATFTAPPQLGTVEFTAGSDDQSNGTQARLVAGLPTVTLRADPSLLAFDNPRFTLSTVVAPPAGGLASPDAPRIDAEASRGVSRMRSSNGSFSLPMRLDASAKATRIQALPAVAPGAGPVAHLLTWADLPTTEGAPALVTVVADHSAIASSKRQIDYSP